MLRQDQARHHSSESESEGRVKDDDNVAPVDTSFSKITKSIDKMMTQKQASAIQLPQKLAK